MRPYICIMGAVKSEIAGIKGEMLIEERVRLAHGIAFVGIWEEYGIVLTQSGIGREQARKTLLSVLDKFELVLVVSMGLAGGADPCLKLGDLVVADKVLRPQQTEDFNFDEKTPAREIILDTALVNKALLLSCPKEATAHCGTLMTIDRIAGKPEDKKNLGENYSVLAVDMETFELAELTHKKDLPFLSIRAVSDTVDEELFDATGFVEEDGEVSTLKAGWYVLKNPGSLKDLMDLRQRSQLATSNLTRFLSQFLRNFK